MIKWLVRWLGGELRPVPFASDEQTLEGIIAGRPDGGDVVILKVSPICPVSSSIERKFDRWYTALPEDNDLTAVKVDVVAARDLSQRLAERYGIRHESPQAIWLDGDLNVKWHGSHFEISAAQLNACFDS